MAHIGEAQLHPLVHLVASAVLAPPQSADGPQRVVQIILRLHRRLPGPEGLPGLPLRVGHLDMGAVTQHDVAETACRIRGKDTALEAVLTELGQHT